MDRPDPAPQGPKPTPGASSSAVPNPAGTTQVSEPQSATALDTSSAPGPSSEAPAPPSSETDAPRAETSQQSPPPTQITTLQPILQHGSPAEQSPSMDVPTSEQPAQAAPTLRMSEPTTGLTPGLTARPTTGSTLGGRSLSDSQIPIPPVPGHRSLEFAPGPGARPTTGSTLGGPGSELQRPPTPPARPSLPQLRTGRQTSVGIIAPSVERLEDAETLSGVGHHESLHRDGARGINQPLPAMPMPMPSQARMVENGYPTRRQRTLDGPGSATGHGPPPRRSGIDWIVPVDEKLRKRTVSERLAPTIINAEAECAKYKNRAKLTGWALNIAIGLQVLLGSITTGLSAVATTGKNTAVQTTVLGALSTLAASYLARARGSGEPEVSNNRVRDLEQFIREAKAFDLDHGHLDDDKWDYEIDHLRRRFEELLGNAPEKREREEREKEERPKEKKVSDSPA